MVKVISKPIERRRFIRYEMNVPVIFSWQGARGERVDGEGIARDIGMTGAYIFSSTCPPVGAVLQVEFLLPKPSGKGETRIEGELRVLRVENNAFANGGSGFAGESLNLSLLANTRF